jgi:hypothetical protein
MTQQLGEPITMDGPKGDLMKAIIETFPKRHNPFTRTLLWNMIRRERARRMRYKGFQKGVWLVGPEVY